MSTSPRPLRDLIFSVFTLAGGMIDSQITLLPLA